MIIPTRNRYGRAVKTLTSLANQAEQPEEVIIVVADDHEGKTDQLSSEFGNRFARFSIVTTAGVGAASQRNEGVVRAKGSLVGFCDDDVDFDDCCIARLRKFLNDHREFAGVGATITNQAPRRLGWLTQCVLGRIDDNKREPLDGRVIGPAINIFPVYDPTGPLYRETEWLSTTTAIYRRDRLPNPVFDPVFEGYSFGEDVALSCRVARRGRLAVLRDARISHDSQPGEHKSDERALGYMEVMNRFYIATAVIGREPLKTWRQLLWWNIFCFMANLRRISPARLLTKSSGTIGGLSRILAMLLGRSKRSRSAAL